jgi:hypothetical protein
VLLIKVGITNQKSLQATEVNKARKYDILANELEARYKSRARLIPYVLIWEGVVTKQHRRYVSELGIPKKLEAYIQSLVLKKTLECVSLDYRRDNEVWRGEGLDEMERAIGAMGEDAEEERGPMKDPKPEGNLSERQGRRRTHPRQWRSRH